MVFLLLRPRWAAGSALAAMLLLAYYYSGLPSRPRLMPYPDLRFQRVAASRLPNYGDNADARASEDMHQSASALVGNISKESDESQRTCNVLQARMTDIDTLKEFPNFEFQPQWMRSKEYWNKSFEDRYNLLSKDPKRPPLKIIIVPHSHNDPGWLHTFEYYLQTETRKIINQIVAKLHEYPKMTFIWSEICFLTAWWDSAHPIKQKALKRLVQSGRLEITSGGWVMPDEATTHIYALLDQFIEGHQWIKNNIGVLPISGWSIDPFGHGATVPYLLAKSGIKGTVIQRIHYAWKQWFALKQWGDFYWQPGWASHRRSKDSLLTHNQPFDIYSIKHSCGPHPYVCLNFDFRKIPGEYTEYSMKAEFITDSNLKAMSELLLEQYSRTGSLLPHNVALIPLGDDFRYNYHIEFDQQYLNYKKMCDYINSNKNLYNAEVSFGTPRDYFNAILDRYDRFPTLKGDFFVYSDIFSEGRPAYWSGYYTTRPFLKILDRDLEHSLRNAEILFTIVWNSARQQSYKNVLRVLEKKYEVLIKARRNLGLFQHHDAITGTSKASVMKDYGLKLFESLQDTIKLQEYCLEIIYINPFKHRVSDELHTFILSDLERDNYNKLPRKLPILMDKQRKIVLFNSLAQKRSELITIRTNSSHVKILNDLQKKINFQINPVWYRGPSRIEISEDEFEVIFIAELPPLSIVTYTVDYYTSKLASSKLASIYCDTCDFQSSPIDTEGEKSKKSHHQPPLFKIKKTLPGDIQLENYKMKLLVDGSTGFLKTITDKRSGKIRQCGIEFAAYQSAQLHSGAYLFMPDINTPEINVLDSYSRAGEGDSSRTSVIFIQTGPISTQVTAIYGPFLSHTLRIYNNESGSMADAIYVENVVDFENPPRNRETELYMRFQTDIQNGEPPEFYTDQNGFQYQKRVKVEKIGIEGNYFPITTMAFLQDQDWRLTYITGHAQGASSFEPGRLEVMLDRRTLYDDLRGMGEGIVDNRKTLFRSWILSESLRESKIKNPLRSKREAVLKQTDYVTFVSKVSNRYRRESKDSINQEGSRRFASGDTNGAYELPSYAATHLSLKLNYPVNIFTVDNIEDDFINSNHIQLLEHAFPDDIHIITLRTLTDVLFPQFPCNSALLVVHRMGFRCTNTSDSGKQIQKANPFKGLIVKSLIATSLTGLQALKEIESLHDLNILPMELHTVNVTFAQ